MCVLLSILVSSCNIGHFPDLTRIPELELESEPSGNESSYLTMFFVGYERDRRAYEVSVYSVVVNDRIVLR